MGARARKVLSSKFPRYLIGFLNSLDGLLPLKEDILLNVYNSYRDDLIFNYLICLDDLERKEDGITIKQLMGVVNDLKIARKCKIVVILNEEELEEFSSSEFKKYREKVADIEIKYLPTTKENLQKVFSGKEIYFNEILRILNKLKATNIRTFNRLKWSIEHVYPFVKACEISLQINVACYLALFCWTFLECSKNLTLSFVQSSLLHHSRMIRSRASSSDFTESQKWWLDEVVAELMIRPADYDADLASLVQYGYLPDQKQFKETVEIENSREKRSKWRREVEKVTEMYQLSFRDNREEIRNLAHQVLTTELEFLRFTDFRDLIRLLDLLEVNTSVYVQEYADKNPEIMQQVNLQWHLSNDTIKNEFLISKIREAQEGKQASESIDKILELVSDGGSPNERKVDFLLSFSGAEIFNWIESKTENYDEDTAFKLYYGLQAFRIGQEANPKYRVIVSNIESALKMIAKKSKIKRYQSQAFLWG
jgi:hypothetical protein